MEKKALVLASVASMIDQFNMPNIRLMIELGYKVDVACNFKQGSTCSDEKVAQLMATLKEMGVECHQIDFARNVLKVTQNLRAYSQTRKLVKEKRYDLIHSHSPIGGLLSRVAARDLRKGKEGFGKVEKGKEGWKGTKVVYTAHGFHFFKGAPLLNWVIFYPIEKFSSRLTDVLVTITHEDYKRAQEKMSAKEVVYVPGVGIDTEAFKPGADAADIRAEKRKELGLKEDDIVLLSVGELNKNKNQEVVVRAMAEIGNKKVHYVIAGRGIMKEHLEQVAEELGVRDQLHLLGFRTDAKELYKMADVFAHPSFREGLSVAVMEAMASSLPVVCTEIRGNTDLIDEGKGGYLFDPRSVDGAAGALKKMLEADDMKAMGRYNAEKAKGLDVKEVMKTMRRIYE